MVWYSHLLKIFLQFIVIHTVKDFGIVNKAEVDIFLELSCLFNDPADVGNLISGSSAFSKSSLNIWKFMVHILLKPGLADCFCALLTAFWRLLYFPDVVSINTVGFPWVPENCLLICTNYREDS